MVLKDPEGSQERQRDKHSCPGNQYEPVLTRIPSKLPFRLPAKHKCRDRTETST
jgi:hypothetical protein